MAIFLNASFGFARGSQSLVLIRDTEIENTLKEWAEPVIIASGLNPASINFILVQDNQVNAFVAGGQNIFIYTGLLLRSDNPAEIIGVLAHELGHIKGGHLIRTRGAMQNASYETILGAVLGIGAAVLTGQGGLATAIAAGTQSSAQGRLLAFSRAQESSADQAALSALEKAHMNPSGLVSFMKKLEGEELLPAAQQNEYVRTHPLTYDRVEAMEAGFARSAYKNEPYSALWKKQHARMVAKLIGFIRPEQVEWKYDVRDKSIAADYARAIAAYRQNNVKQALDKMAALLANEPENPYFLELKGQMLVDFGRVEQALSFYRKSIQNMADAPLVRVAYAQALIESPGADQKRLSEAAGQLLRALKDEPRMSRIHRLLATVYGRLGQEPRAKLHLAEEALLQGNMPYAKRQAEAAREKLEKGSNSWLRAQDILNFIDHADKKN